MRPNTDVLETQLDALLRAEASIGASEPSSGTSLFNRTTPASAEPNATVDEDQANLARALAQSARETTTASSSSAAAPDASEEDRRLQAALAASEQSYLAERSDAYGAVLGVLTACSPVVSSFVEEHCGVFVASAVTYASSTEVELYGEFRGTVDAALSKLIAEAGVSIEDVARTLHRAREQSEQSHHSLVTLLLAVESFSSFRRLSAHLRFRHTSNTPSATAAPLPRMAHRMALTAIALPPSLRAVTSRNESMHREAREALGGGGGSSSSSYSVAAASTSMERAHDTSHHEQLIATRVMIDGEERARRSVPSSRLADALLALSA